MHAYMDNKFEIMSVQLNGVYFNIYINWKTFHYPIKYIIANYHQPQRYVLPKYEN